MATKIKTNMGAVRAHGRLDKNDKARGKSLRKVATGMKINSAEDDASSWGISERMRVRIRALEQADQNAQNDSSLMKTAPKVPSTTRLTSCARSRPRQSTRQTTATRTKIAKLFRRKSTNSSTKSTTTRLSPSTANIC